MRVLMIWGLVLLSSCASLRRPQPHDGPTAPPPPPAFSAVTAPIEGRGGRELAILEAGAQTDGARLRIAYIRQENREYLASVEALNRLLYGEGQLDPRTEALARWLRGRAFALEGKSAGVIGYELDQAERLAQDPALLAAIATMRREHGAPDPRNAVARPPALELRGRAAWQAANANERRMQRMGGVSRVTIHHSASLLPGHGEAASIEVIQGIQRYHQREQHWGDIGYHFLIDPDGRVWTGRSLAWQGAHAGDDSRNRGNIGICLLGNFMPSEDGAPPTAQLEAMDELVRRLCERYRIAPSEVFTHRELKSETTCPGPYLQTAVQSLRKRLAQEQVAARP